MPPEGRPTRRFRYRGRTVEARDGESLLAALFRGGLGVLERSTRYRRPRAPFCGVGQCTGCLVRVNGRPLVRSCRYSPAEGDVVEEGPGWPSVRVDLLGVLDYLFPSGLDPFHGFRRPAFAVPLYQRLVRRLAGYGPLPSEPNRSPSAVPSTIRTADLAVVGAGKSGRAVARRLVERGRRPLVIDRTPRAPDLDGAELVRDATVTSLSSHDGTGGRTFTLVGTVGDTSGLLVRAREVVVATGGYDASLLFDGNDRPGVMTADAALALTPAQERSWFARSVVVGGGGRAGEVLARFGERVGAVVAFADVQPEVVRAASDLEIPIYPRSLLLAARGRARVRSLELRSRRGGSTMTVRCDAVVLAHRRLPNAQLLPLAGATMEWRSGQAAFYPVVDGAGRTTVPGLYAVGEVAGFLPEATVAAALRTADAVAGDPGVVPSADAERVRASGPHELEGYYRECFRERVPRRAFACRCEDILVSDLAAAHRAGYRGIEVVKRYTSLGTGLCQGRFCVPDAIVVLAGWEGRPPDAVGTVRQRPPIFPSALGALADLDGAIPKEAP